MTEEYKVTARKWRPRRFSDVSSQEFITTTLKNSVINKRVSHAYLFSGPRGVGKTTVARILAKAINCLNPGKGGEPCNECQSCVEINNENRNHPDVFEIDGASNRNIDDVRELKEKVKYGPIRSKFKIFIIDEVHMLTGASFNALLKTLEEPPEYIVFIFATTAPEKVPLTILGRCQRFDFKRLTSEEIISRLKLITKEEGIKIDDESLFFMAKKGDGSMRDSQGLLDIATAYCGKNIKFEQLKVFFNLAESDIYFRITDYIKQKSGHELLMYLDELINAGYDLQTILEGLQEHIRNMLVVKSTGSATLLTETDAVKKKYLDSADRMSEIELLNSLKLMIQTESIFKYSSNQRIMLEVLLMELMKFADTREISTLADELKELKKNSSRLSIPEQQVVSQPSAAAKRSQTEFRNEAGKGTEFRNEAGKGTELGNEKGKGTELGNEKGKRTDIAADANGGDITVETHWEILKEQIRNEKKWIYSLIKNFTMEWDGKKKYFIRTEPGQFDMLLGYTDYISTKVCAYFGDESRFEFTRIQSPVPETKTKPANNNFEKICDTLIHEFHGRYID